MTEQAAKPPALAQNLELVDQGIALLDALPPGFYAEVEDEPGFRETLGPHLRHCIDAYLCLLDGLERGYVDYDARSRSRSVERSRQAALAALNDLREQLSNLDAPPERVLEVQIDVPGDGDHPPASSTLGREYQFLVGHTVHHYALIAMILRRRGFDPGAEFGVAPSTLRYWRDKGA